MPYTINYFYEKFLNKIDKEGSDLYSPAIVMEILETETYNFIEQTVKYLENTQLIKEYLLPISVPLDVPLAANPANAEEMIGTIPADYLMLHAANVIIPGVTVRKTRIFKIGELDIHKLNPNKKPTSEYPAIIMYSNYLAVYGDVNATDVKGFYISKPIYGNVAGDLDVEITVNLPDLTLEKIMNLMVNAIHAKEGDPRYQASYNQEQSYGKSNK